MICHPPNVGQRSPLCAQGHHKSPAYLHLAWLPFQEGIAGANPVGMPVLGLSVTESPCTRPRAIQDTTANRPGKSQMSYFAETNVEQLSTRLFLFRQTLICMRMATPSARSTDDILSQTLMETDPFFHLPHPHTSMRFS